MNQQSVSAKCGGQGIFQSGDQAAYRKIRLISLHISC